MRKYEAFIIIDPDLSEDTVIAVDDKLKNIVTTNGGAVLDYVPWGKKKLAYAVKKRNRGHYVVMEFAGAAGLVAELERNMRLDERVLKFITVKLADRYDPEAEPAKDAKAVPRFSDEEESYGSAAALIEEEVADPGEKEDLEAEEEGEE